MKSKGTYKRGTIEMADGTIYTVINKQELTEGNRYTVTITVGRQAIVHKLLIVNLLLRSPSREKVSSSP